MVTRLDRLMIGAALVLVSLIEDFNLGAMLIESFWLLVSVYGLMRRAT